LLISDFVQDVGVNLAMKHSIEERVESVPQAIERETWLIIVLDGFYS